MRAGDLVQNNKIFNSATETAATLTMKRNALEDRDVKRALELVHIAFFKPIVSPRDPAKNTFESPFFLDLAVFRSLARLLSLVEYVALADGKTSEALGAMEDCLRMARLIPAESIINGLVFVAVDAIAVSVVARHATQLSFRDSERLEGLCEKWLRDTDSFAAAFTGERDILMRQFKDKAPKPDDLLHIVNPDAKNGNAENPDETPEEKALKARLMEHPEDAAKIYREAQEGIKTFYDAVIAEAKKDAWERKPVAAPKAEPAVKAIMDGVVPTMALVLNKQDQDKANLHLLGTFAALERYRWIHRRYPDALNALRSPILTIDPFTGEFLLYKREGGGYDLHSAGPLGEGGKTRTPLYLPYRKI